MHPKAIEAQERSIKAKHEKALRKEWVNTQAERNKLRFVHVRPSLKSGGVTVLYRLPERKKDRVIEVSVALCHRNDTYCKVEGRYQAALNWTRGQAIRLRAPKGMTVPQFLWNIFHPAAMPDENN